MGKRCSAASAPAPAAARLSGDTRGGTKGVSALLLARRVTESSMRLSRRMRARWDGAVEHLTLGRGGGDAHADLLLNVRSNSRMRCSYNRRC